MEKQSKEQTMEPSEENKYGDTALYVEQNPQL